MAGIRPPDNATQGPAPESTVERNVPYLFLVRNMFFFGEAHVYPLNSVYSPIRSWLAPEAAGKSAMPPSVTTLFKRLNGLLGFGNNIAWVFSALGLSGAVLMGWLSTQWHFFWTTLGWFGVAGVGLVTWFLIGLGLSLYRVFWKAEASASTPKPTAKSYLKDVRIFAGSEGPPQNPRFTGKFTKNGSRCRIFVDNSYFAGGLGWSGWTQRRRIFIAEIKDFVAEQMLDVPLLVPFEHQGQNLWRWPSRRAW